MPAGVPTDEALVEEFRAEFLYSGNASAAAKKVGIPDRTGRKIAERLEDDPSFAEDGRKLRARCLDRLVTMRMSVAEIAAARYAEDLPVPEVVGDGASVTIIDKRPDHGKLVLEAEKNAQSLAKFEAERDGVIQPEREVTIRIVPAKSPEDDDGGEKA